MSNITKQPDELGFIQSNNWIKILPDNLGIPAVEYASIKFDFDNISAGNWVELNGVRFTVSDQIDDIDTFLSLSNYTNPVLKQATIDSFINAINSSPILNTKYKAYEISELGYVVKVEALYRGPQYDLEINSSLPGLFYLPVPADNGYETDQYDGFGYELEVMKSTSMFKELTPYKEEKVAVLSTDLSDGQEAYFNLSSYMEAPILYPSFGGNVLTNTFNRYKAKVYRKYLNSFNIPQREYLFDSDYVWAVEGGINPYQQLTEQPTEYYQSAPNKVFNTSYKHKIDKAQSKFLSFLYYHSLGTSIDFELMLEVKLKYVSGTSSTYYVSIGQPALISSDLDGIHHLDVSYNTLGIADKEELAGMDVVWYDVAVVISLPTGKISYTQPVRYELTEDCTETNVELIWLNSLGGWDSFLFTGINNKDIDFKQSRFMKADIPDMDSTRFSDSVYKSSLTDTLSLNSRYLKEGELEWLKDLITSPYVYIVKLGSLIPVLVSKPNYSYNSLEDVYTLGLELDYSYSKAVING